MKPSLSLSCTAFVGTRHLTSGTVEVVARLVKQTCPDAEVAALVFDDATGQTVEIDWRGSADDVVARLAAPIPPPRGPGRPKLGVTAREVTLLPRHWEWLAQQPGGASVALRKLVEAARRDYAAKDSERTAQEAAYRFMVTITGDASGFEDAARALFAGDVAGLATALAAWPEDIRSHVLKLAALNGMR